MAIYETKLGMVVEALGRYYSVVSKEKFMSVLAFGGEEPVGNFGKVSLNPTPEHERLIQTFTDATEGGVIMAKNFEALKSLMDGLEGPDKEDAKNLIQGVYRYIGEAETFETIWPDWKTVCSSISVSDMCDLKPGSDGSKDGVINGAFSSPTKFTPNLCAIEVFNPKLVPAARDTGAAGLFMNALPSMELSRCQPYLDITVVSPAPGLSDDNRVQSIGLMQHLVGQSQVTSDADIAIASAVNEAAIQGQLEKHDSESAANRAAGKDLPEIPGLSTAGMEMFTTPQSLVPVLGRGSGATMETYGDFDAFQDIKGDDGKPISAGGRRGAPIIDPFRPLMSIDDFSIGVSPSRGMMSHKTAELSLTLHDRSRLSEVGEFVKPDLYGKSELMITYGWSHPDDSADLAAGKPGASPKLMGNFYGSFLNAMKVTEKYMIVNSSFSFDDVGQVKIKLKLSMKGASNIDTNTIAQGEDIELAVQGIKDMMEVVKKIKKKILTEAKSMGDDSAKDMFGESFFSAASSTSRAMTMDEESQKALKKFISANRGASGDVGTLAGSLENMFGSDGTGGAVSKLQETIAGTIGKKMEALAGMRVNNKDPFAKTVAGHGGSTKFVDMSKDSSKYISYGAMLMYMVGKPLAATRRFDEIQFIFYPINDKASYLKDCTTAQIPINILDFGVKFEEYTKTDVNLPLGRFMGFIGKEFIHNQASEAYGMAALYEADDEGKKSVKKDLKENPSKLNDEKKQRLEDAYGAGEDIVFKMPRIRFHIEAVPGKVTGHPEGKRATILRIHVYDAVCTPHTALGKLMTASRSNSLGLMTTSASKAAKSKKAAPDSDDAEMAVTHAKAFYEELKAALDYGLLEAVPSLSGDPSDFDPEKQPETYFRVKGGFPALKNFMQTTMPTIIYGSTNSAVLSADVSSMNNPQLASINMMRGGMGGGTTAQGTRDSGVPLQTAPVSLSLTTFGCPVVNYGQSFFIDFGTGTTIDNVYVVSGIDHSISQGKFETKLKMTQVDAFGKYTSMMTNVTKALSAMSDKKSDG